MVTVTSAVSMSDNSDCVVGDTVAELDLERGDRGRPVEHALPPSLGFGDREVDQLPSGVLGGEVPARLDDLPGLAVERFDGVGGVDHAADLGRVGQERGDLLPVLEPAG